MIEEGEAKVHGAWSSSANPIFFFSTDASDQRKLQSILPKMSGVARRLGRRVSRLRLKGAVSSAANQACTGQPSNDDYGKRKTQLRLTPSAITSRFPRSPPLLISPQLQAPQALSLLRLATGPRCVPLATESPIPPSWSDHWGLVWQSTSLRHDG
jgi:hypothetical protein